jgi:uncharacterized membrane protein YgcG
MPLPNTLICIMIPGYIIKYTNIDLKSMFDESMKPDFRQVDYFPAFSGDILYTTVYIDIQVLLCASAFSG